MALFQSRLGWANRNSSKIDMAMENYLEALILHKKINPQKYRDLLSILNNIAIIYTDFKLYNQAIIYYDSAIAIYDKYMDLQYDVSLAHKKKDLLYFKASALVKTGDDIKMQKGLEILTDIYNKKDTLYGARILNKVGVVFTELKEYDKARKQFDILFSHPQLTPRYRGMTYQNIGNTYLEQGSLYMAEEYFLKALKVKGSLGNKRSLFITMSDLGETYIKQNRYKEAVRILGTALDTYDQVTRKPEYYVAYSLLATAYTRIDLKKYDTYNAKFLAADKAYIQQQQKLRDDARQKKILMTVSGFMNNIKLKEEKQKFLERYWTTTLLVLVVITIISIYYIKKYKARTAALKEIKAINEEAERKGFWYL